MADTYVIHENQTGAVSNYAVPFEYLSTAHVKVAVNDVPTAFSFLSTYLISILPNPVGKVKIYRDTPDEAITTFTDGSVLLDSDLNSAYYQSIYISQEAKDTATDEMANAIAEMDAIHDDTVADAEAIKAAAIADTTTIKNAAEAARDTAITKASEAAASAADALTQKNAATTKAGEAAASATAAATSEANALSYRNTASTKADEAAASAAAAAASAASISGGPVVSVNGRGGAVTGLAEADDVYTKVAADALLANKVNTSAIGTAAAKAADTDGALTANSDANVPTQKAVRTLVDPLVPQIGDIRYSLRTSVAGFLPLDGSVYLKSAYPALMATGLIPAWDWKDPVNMGLYTGGSQTNAQAWNPLLTRYSAITITSSPYLRIVDWNTGVPVAAAIQPATAPAGIPNDVKFSPDGRWMAVTHGTAPYVTIYDWQSGTPVKIANPGTFATAANRCEFSPNSRYLAVANAGVSPYIVIYDLNSGLAVKIADPATLPNINVNNVTWSPDGRYMAVCGSTSPYVMVYDWQSGSPVKIANPVSLPVAAINHVTFTRDSRYLICAGSANPTDGIVIYDLNSGLLVRTYNFLNFSGTLMDFAWAQNGRYLAARQSGGEYFVMFDFAQGLPPKKIRTGLGVSSTVYSFCFSPDGKYLSYTTSTTSINGANGYAWVNYDPSTEFRLPEIENGWIKAA